MKRIESIKNPQVKQWKKLHTKKERDKTGTFMIEGFHLVEDALKSNAVIRELIMVETVDLPANWNVDNQSIVLVTEEIMKEISDTETSQGIAAICEQYNDRKDLTSFSKLLLIDAVQDPGNLGTMIRTADAAGIDAVIIGEGSVDVYNSKVLRSTQGSIFHIPIIKANLFQMIGKLKEKNVKVFGTSLKNAVDFKEVSSESSFALIMGNEGNGVNPDLLELTDQNLYIPIYGESESLNVAVAAGILLYHLR
ncbi:TrmH family RNA methyltransferase [Ferdinandcohnia quinoae]|uniref:RNA methyltransferase n=1 Tax=Fredinandcohnia quinoae TaxID=2918902 RepID=A0AAW5E747_9BACI|nr:RNA methyltransferase [Fredinandcohnia sp. SECRCQ15]MCH1627314.1 RNA methyltransferase [Fredinandcohnia sp. SECRCQ15]